ncbi:hypothetical protein L1049_028551 [Liquidambar formosana]|uniref:SMP-LTD domain-containing protein n=1 Tax=Liquidambar formosana TaxID=63359 RepID=A0AAP0RJ20_LIQFO
MLLTLLVGFLFGALTILVVEALGFLVVLSRLTLKSKQGEAASASQSQDLDLQQSLVFASKKQGVVWVLDSEKVPKICLVDKVPNEQKRKKEILEVSPVRKHAKIKDQSLILTDSDGSHTVQLKGCTIVAVSATSLSSRKWARKYPIRVESKSSVIYNGSKTFYIYLETSWDKESWCKALRIASCEDKERLKWFVKLSIEFHSYLTSLNAGYPSFMKPSMGFYSEPYERENKLDDSSSKVRLFWKKLAKKATKTGENRPSWATLSGREEKKISEKSRTFQDSFSASGVVKTATTGKTPNSSVDENIDLSSLSTFTHSGSQSHISVSSDADANDKFGVDEGTLCWNLLISRLFFDAKSNAEMKSSMQARIQRTLSNMRIPSYIGEVICTGMDLGNLPPYIHGMRVLPVDMNEVWAFEIDIEYSGGALLDIETRLEVRELENQKRLADINSESSSVGGVTSDLLEGFECYRKQLTLSHGTVDPPEQKDDGDLKMDGLKSTKSTISTSTNVSRWKSILNSVAKQVSQVPISLAIRVASLRGTVRLHIKPPPSDQLWIGFTSMPDIDFNLESSVGEHKITSGRIALFLVNRFKAAIRETLVLPNCESICIPWMLAEKDDWVPGKVAPFIWLNQQAVSDPTILREVPSSQPGEAKSKLEVSMGASSDHLEDRHDIPKNVECVQHQTSESSDALAFSSSPTKLSTQSSKSSQELRTHSQQSREDNTECQSSSRSIILSEARNHTMEEDEARPKRMGRRARMLDLGKKMGEKLEEKKRHIEEKGKSIVEKMRGP